MASLCLPIRYLHRWQLPPFTIKIRTRLSEPSLQPMQSVKEKCNSQKKFTTSFNPHSTIAFTGTRTTFTVMRGTTVFHTYTCLTTRAEEPVPRESDRRTVLRHHSTVVGPYLRSYRIVGTGELESEILYPRHSSRSVHVVGMFSFLGFVTSVAPVAGRIRRLLSGRPLLSVQITVENVIIFSMKVAIRCFGSIKLRFGRTGKAQTSCARRRPNRPCEHRQGQGR